MVVYAKRTNSKPDALETASTDIINITVLETLRSECEDMLAQGRDRSIIVATLRHYLRLDPRSFHDEVINYGLISNQDFLRAAEYVAAKQGGSREEFEVCELTPALGTLFTYLSQVSTRIELGNANGSMVFSPQACYMP